MKLFLCLLAIVIPQVAARMKSYYELGIHTRCEFGIVEDQGPRNYVGKMGEEDCKTKAREKETTYVWGNGDMCYLYNQRFDVVRGYSQKKLCCRLEWRTCNPDNPYEIPNRRWSALAMTTSTNSTPLAVNVFAAVGLSALLFGAYRHYTQK